MGIVIIGNSRGGTHLFWRLTCAYYRDNLTQEEINDLVGIRRIGLLRKVMLESFMLIGISLDMNIGVEPHTVQKLVCSWSPNKIFRILRRNDPTKYLRLHSLRQSKVLIIVKSPESQVKSWMRRGCSKTEALRAYNSNITRWLKLKQDKVFLRYEDFIMDPQKMVEKCFDILEIDIKKPSSVTFAPKNYRENQSYHEAGSKERKYITNDISEFLNFIDKDSVVSPTESLALKNQTYANIPFVS